MANHKSAEKRNRQNIKTRERNRVVRAAVRLAFKKARAAIDTKSPTAKELVVAAERAIAKATSKGLFHKNNASRKVGRLHGAATK